MNRVLDWSLSADNQKQGYWDVGHVAVLPCCGCKRGGAMMFVCERYVGHEEIFGVVKLYNYVG